MNKGIRKEQRYLQQTIGSAGTTYINLNKNNANMHLTIPLVDGLSLVYNLLDKDIDTGFGKGLRLNYYNKLTYDETNDKYLIEQADGTIVEFINDTNIPDNNYWYILDGYHKYVNCQYYSNNELSQILQVQSESGNTEYLILDSTGTIINYNLNNQYPLDIIYKSGKTIEFEYLTSTTKISKIKYIKGNKCIREIEFDYTETDKIKVLVKHYDKNEYKIILSYSSDGTLSVVSYNKYVSDNGAQELYVNTYTFGSNIIVVDGLNNYCLEYQIHDAILGRISKVIEKNGDKEVETIDIIYHNQFTRLQNKDQKTLIINYSQDDLPMCEIDSNKMAISYKYDENKRLEYVTKPICINEDNSNSQTSEERYENLYKKLSSSQLTNVDEISITTPVYLTSTGLKFNSGGESKYEVVIDQRGSDNEHYALAFSYKMGSSDYNGVFDIKISQIGLDGEDEIIKEESLPKLSLSDENQDDWFYRMIPFTTNGKFESIRLKFIYNDLSVVGYLTGIKLLKINCDLETKKTFSYDTINSNNILYSYEYNEKNQVSKVTTSLGNSVQYEYDESGNVTKEVIVSDNNQSEILYVYDDNDNIISTTDETGVTINYVYEGYETERIIASTEEIATRAFEVVVPVENSLRKIEYLYDKYDRLRSIYSYGGTHSINNEINYNNRNLVDNFSIDQGKNYKFTYDDYGRVISVGIKKNYNSSIFALENYTYYFDENQENQAYPINLLKSINYSGNDSYTYEYDESYNLTYVRYHNSELNASEDMSDDNQNQEDDYKYNFKYYKDNLLKQAISKHGIKCDSVEYKYDTNDLLTNIKYTKDGNENTSLDMSYNYDNKNKLTSKQYTIEGESRVTYYQDYRKQKYTKEKREDVYKSVLGDEPYYRGYFGYDINPGPITFDEEKISFDSYSDVFYVSNDEVKIDSNPLIYNSEGKETILFLYKPRTYDNDILKPIFNFMNPDGLYIDCEFGIYQDKMRNTYLYYKRKTNTDLEGKEMKISLQSQLVEDAWNFIAVTLEYKKQANALAYTIEEVGVCINGRYMKFDPTQIGIYEDSSNTTFTSLKSLYYSLDCSKRYINKKKEEPHFCGDVAEVFFIPSSALCENSLLLIYRSVISFNFKNYINDEEEYVTSCANYDYSSNASNVSFVPLYSDLLGVRGEKPLVEYQNGNDKNDYYNFNKQEVKIYNNEGEVTDVKYCNHGYGYVINNNSIQFKVGTHKSGYVSFRYYVDYIPGENEKIQICEFRNNEDGEVLFNIFLLAGWLRIVKADNTIIQNVIVNQDMQIDFVILHNKISNKYGDYLRYTFYINGSDCETKIELDSEFDDNVDELYVKFGSTETNVCSLGIIELLSYSAITPEGEEEENNILDLDLTIGNHILKLDSFKTMSYYDSKGRIIRKQVLKSTRDPLILRYVKCIYDDIVVSETTYKYKSNTNLIKEEIQKYGDSTHIIMYEYDNFGNIISEEHDSNNLVENNMKYLYYYDSNNRLQKVEEKELCVDDNGVKQWNLINTVVYNYNNKGNILSKYQDPNVTSYTYSNTYPDVLTGYGQYEIVYGANDNNWLPLQLKVQDNVNFIYEWEGKTLTSVEDKTASKKYRYEYDHNGMRTRKEVCDISNSVSSSYIFTDYIYEGTKLLMEVHSDYKLEYLYDEYECIIGVKYITNNKKESYFYIRDITGKITKIINEEGNVVGEYKYETYGKIIATNNLALVGEVNIADINPIRYKGYYYDVETELFWLSSRYYSPELCRFISPDDVEYLDPSSINGLNLYAYCGNDPINRYDPTGHAWDVILDIFSIGWSLYDFIKDPSWENFGWLALDVVFAVVPFLTGSSIMKAASKLDDVSDIGGYMNKFDNVYDSIVIGNDMGRVTNLAFDTGSMIYDGYKPMNALYAMGRADEITDAMRYAAKVDNARFIMDKYKAGYKIINAGSDGRGFFKMMKSSYGMELKILYRLKYGNKLHKLWWILNSGRRIIW